MNATLNDPEIAALATVSAEEFYGPEQFTPEIKAELNAFYNDLDKAAQDEVSARREYDFLDYRAELLDRD